MKKKSQASDNEGMKLNCTIKLLNGDEPISIEEIITSIKALPQYEIIYSNSFYKYDEEKKRHIMEVELETQGAIDTSISGGGLYFILSLEGDKLLYVGKSKNLPIRLKQHLVECSASTYSHIQDVCRYMQGRKESNKKLSLKYCVINTVDDIYNATIEGAIIDYILNNSDDPFLDRCWNKRHD